MLFFFFFIIFLVAGLFAKDVRQMLWIGGGMTSVAFFVLFAVSDPSCGLSC